MNNGYPYIYLLTDRSNGKQYIGKSCGKYSYFTGGKIPRRIITKYGKNAFIKEIIERGDYSNTFLNALEKHYIKEYDTFNYGYNLTLGGDDGASSLSKETRDKINKSKEKIIYMFDLEGNYYKKFNSVTEASIKLNCPVNTISKCLHNNIAFRKEYQFSFDEMAAPFCNRRHKVLKVYKEKELIETYRNATEASQDLGIPLGSIHYFVNKGFSKKHNLKFKISE
jgi:hypothetical protein